MENLNEVKKNEIIRNICDFNLKKLISNLNDLKNFSKEKSKLKILKNKQEFMVNNKLQYKNGENSYNFIENDLKNILKKINP
jgi:hypothetical protein